MSKKRLFKPSNSNRKPQRRCFIAIDTETTSSGEFICGGIVGERLMKNGTYKKFEYFCETLQDFRQKFQEAEQLPTRNKYALIGYNVDYDLIYLGDIIDSSTRMYASSRLITARTHAGTEVIDLMNHVTGKLSDWMTRLNMYATYGIYERDGYLDSEQGKRDQVMDDTRATYHLGMWIQDMYTDTFNTSIRPTKFSNALAIYRDNYFSGYWVREPREDWKNDFERESYYGGRTEVFKRGEQHVTSYDINGMYVAIMADKEVPNPTITQYLTEHDVIMQHINAGDIMTVECDVIVPHRRIGLLPSYRDGKLVFMTGRLSGVWNSIELKTAIKHGLTIVKAHRALYYPETQKYFAEYAKMTQIGRQKAKEEQNEAVNLFYKALGNGLYGKFGQRNSSGGQYINVDDYEGDETGLTRIPHIDGTVRIYTPKTEQEDSNHTFPVIPATITAYARSQLLDALICNEQTVVYCDTDSIKTRGEPLGLTKSDLPGDWGYEYTRTECFYRPKTYGVKRKGIPKKAVKVSESENRETYTFEKPIKYKSSVRRNLYQNYWEQLEKTIDLRDDKRDWHGNDSMPIQAD